MSVDDRYNYEIHHKIGVGDFLEVDRGVITAAPRHLRLVSSTTGPTYTEVDEDPYEREQRGTQRRRNPAGVAVILSLVCAVVLMGVVGWAAF